MMATLPVNSGPGVTTAHDATVTPGMQATGAGGGFFAPTGGGLSNADVMGRSALGGGGAGWVGGVDGSFGGSALGGGPGTGAMVPGGLGGGSALGGGGPA